MILIQKGQRQSSESWVSRTLAWNLARLIEGEVCLSPPINANEMHDLCSQDLQPVPGNVFSAAVTVPYVLQWFTDRKSTG
jgi:hypothetical protein